MNKEILKQYASIKRSLAGYEEKLAELKPLILKEMEEEGVDKVPTSLGNFNVKKLKKWKYSEKVEELKELLDAKKGIEEADGTATFTEMPILEFREMKENN